MSQSEEISRVDPGGRRPATPRKFAGPRYRSRSWRCPHPSNFSIMVVYAADDVLLQLTGHLDAEAADAFDDCVTTAIGEQPRRLVLDLSALGSMDLIGSDCLRKASESATGAGVHLVLDSPNESVLRVLESAMLRDGYSIR